MQSDEDDDDEDNHDDNINEDNEEDHVNGYEDSCDDLTTSLRMEQVSFTGYTQTSAVLQWRVVNHLIQKLRMQTTSLPASN